MTSIWRKALVLVVLSASSPAFAEGEVIAGEGAAAAGEAGETFIKEPFVAPEGKIRAYAGYTIDGTTDEMTMASRLEDRFAVGAGFGVTNELTVGGQFDFGPGIGGDNEFEIMGDLTLFGMMQVINDGSLNLTPVASAFYDLCDSKDAGNACVTSLGLAFGAGIKYLVTPEFAIYSGSPVGPGPIGQHLKVSLDDKGAITFALPAGVIYQAGSELAVFASTLVTEIGISNDDTQAVFGADFIPLTIGASFALSPTLDLEAEIETRDIPSFDDEYRLFFGIRLDL